MCCYRQVDRMSVEHEKHAADNVHNMIPFYVKPINEPYIFQVNAQHRMYPKQVIGI